MEIFDFAGAPGKKLKAMLWLPEGDPVAVVQITHGMTEHMGRWTSVARSLAEKGIATAGFDLRGHGDDRVVPQVASFGEGDWAASLEDMHCFFSLLDQRFPGLPHYMLGFSLGSFLLREYLGLYPEGIAGAVLVGTGQQPGALLGLLQAVVKPQIAKAGWDGATPLVHKLSFETYNSRFSPNRTTADWLCADETQLDEYLRDEKCRAYISAGLFWQLLGSMKRCGRADSIQSWDKNIPILLLSGTEDPVGDMGRGVRTVERQLHKAGLGQVEVRLLPGARHDLFHEEASGAAGQARAFLCQWIGRTR